MEDNGNAPQMTAGGPILRHTAGTPTFADVDLDMLLRFADHIEKHYGPDVAVIQEPPSEQIFAHIAIAPPTRARPYTTLITCGMSTRPMAVPDDDTPRLAEIVMSLPPDWPLDKDSWRNERYYWPIRCLKTLAKLPHQYGTWLGWGHSVPNGDPATPYAFGTRFSGVLLLLPRYVTEEFEILRNKAGEEVRLLGAYPLHAAEMDFKLRHGALALAERFDAADISELLDPRRPSVV